MTEIMNLPVHETNEETAARLKLISWLEANDAPDKILRSLKNVSVASWQDTHHAEKWLQELHRLIPEFYNMYVILSGASRTTRATLLRSTKYRTKLKRMTQAGFVTSINEFELNWLLLNTWSFSLPKGQRQAFDLQCQTMSDAVSALRKLVENSVRVGTMEGVPGDLLNDFYAKDKVARTAWRLKSI